MYDFLLPFSGSSAVNKNRNKVRLWSVGGRIPVSQCFTEFPQRVCLVLFELGWPTVQLTSQGSSKRESLYSLAKSHWPWPLQWAKTTYVSFLCLRPGAHSGVPIEECETLSETPQEKEEGERLAFMLRRRRDEDGRQMQQTSAGETNSGA